MSYEYFTNNPYLKKFFTPRKSSGTAINGSDVLSTGDVFLKFQLQGVPMSITCKVVKGLMDPVILGWDWMSKYGVALDAANGKVSFGEGKCAPLIEYDVKLQNPFYRVFEDLILPPNSKVHTNVELVMNDPKTKDFSTTVVTEPFTNNGVRYWAARGCSTMRDGRFMTEFLNPSNQSVRIPAGEIVGNVEFIKDEELRATYFETEMSCSYRDPVPDPGEVSPSVGPTASRASTRSAPPTSTPDQGPANRYCSSTTMDARDDSIPPGAKPLSLDLSQISEDARPYEAELRDLLQNKHAKAFSRHDRDYGKTGLVQYRAHLKDPDLAPIAQKPYRTRPEMREAIDQQAHQMLADGLVRHSTSPFAAPILMERKKCGGWRFLTDFRRINECCTKVVFPLPRIEDSIQKLENPRFFSSMDLTKGFWQVPIHPDDRKFFAFSTENMHLEYLVAPMGAKNSPSYLSLLMQLVLRGLPVQHVISYLDDILVADSNMEDHLKHLDLVLTALEKAGLKLNPAKCAFARESVVCLGHKLSREGVS